MPVFHSLKPTMAILRETFSQWIAERAQRMAASLAFYTTFSLAPLMIIVVAIAGLVFGQEAAQGRLVGQIEHLIGTEGARTVESLIESARKPATGIMAGLVGIATMLFGASGVFGELQDSLNTIWNVQPKPKGGMMEVLKSRFVSFAMVIGVGFLLLVSLVISAMLSAVTDFTGNLVPLLLPVIQIIDFVLSFVTATVLFALLFRLVPDAKIRWSDVWPGAAVTSLLFVAGKQAISLYLGHSSFSSTYGAVGSLVVVLLWVYYSAQILFFGAELTEVCARSRRRVVPRENAVEAMSPEKSRRLQMRLR